MMKCEYTGSRLTANSILTEQSPSTSHKNLLIGAITNYIWDDVAPFFNSYKQAGFENCDCVIYIGSMSEKTQAKIRACGVEVLPVPERFNGTCVNDFRWELYRDYLREHADDYNMVFTADVRDTIFQSDVFKCYEDSGAFLGIALEEDTLSNEINKGWLTARYGRAVYESMKQQRIIFTGTVWGTAQEFLSFTSAMVEHINSQDYPYFRVCDQAAGNWLIYHEKMFSNILRPSTNYDGAVMTVCHEVKLSPDGMILNTTGKAAAVVHQYDRNTQLLHSVVKRYCAGYACFRKAEAETLSGLLGACFAIREPSTQKRPCTFSDRSRQAQVVKFTLPMQTGEGVCFRNTMPA